MHDLDKEEILHNYVDSPLFFIYPVRKNKAYIDLLVEVLTKKSKIIEHVAELLISHQWSVEPNHLASIENHTLKTADIAYCAWLLNKIPQEVFQDYILYTTLKESFSETLNSFYPLPKAKRIDWINVFSEDRWYLKQIINKAWQSTTFNFNEALFTAELEKKAAYYFTVTLDREEFISAIENTDHAEWMNLFLSTKYPLIIFDLTKDEVQISIPSMRLLSAFLKAIVNEEKDLITPVMAYGILSADTSLRLHRQGLHIISIQDNRFKSITKLHGANSNGFEVVMHDLLFHTITLSARSTRLRRLFWNSIVPLLKSHIDSEAHYLNNLTTQEKKAAFFFYTHLLETSLDVSMQIPKKKAHSVTELALSVFAMMLLGSIRQTQYYFIHELNEEELILLVTQILKRLFTYWKSVSRLNLFLQLVNKYFYSTILEIKHPAQHLLIQVALQLTH